MDAVRPAGPPTGRKPRPGSLLLAGALFGCAGAAPAGLPGGRAAPLPPLSLAADSAVIDSIAPGLVHHAFLVRRGPWRIHVLDLDRAGCWSVGLLPASPGATGRVRTSELVNRATGAVAGVNADFFTPTGHPVGAAVERGRVIAGPGRRPVFAIDSAGRPWIGVLRVAGRLDGGGAIPIDQWNRTSDSGVAFLEPWYAGPVDTEALVIPASPGRLVAGIGVPDSVRRALSRRPAWGPPALRLAPFHPLEAAGGFPVLVRDSAVVAGLDSAGGRNFGPVRHPRTIVAIAAGGRRLLLITVDGRQPGYSEGTTLLESAALLLELGATEGLNLDGGGSTTMAIRRGGGPAAVVNRPSDSAGERPVGNALGVVGCGRGGEAERRSVGRR